MATLRLDTIRVPAADLGPENPLPPLARTGVDVHEDIDTTGMDAEMARNVGIGRLTTLLPYRIQDGYSRERTPRDLTVAVLQNEHLTATFLLDFGGRLWSLRHRPSGRELLHRNRYLQLANLALRNAWFAGGVEWNISATGHSPLTCAPVHAARVDARVDGRAGPVLRIYEWERWREVVYSVDFWLSEQRPVLLAHPTITNHHDTEIPMYWWSNIAVPEGDDIRVVVPAARAYRFGYPAGLRTVPIPLLEGIDVSYPRNADSAVDYFFDVRDSPRPWITALDGAGTGLVQTSTRRLRGRKLFLWGQGAAGRRWQQFLSGPGQRYLEIQAGLARTQLERVPMPARTTWSWTEAYGLLRADPARVHGPDWSAARAEVEDRLAELVPAKLLARADAVAGDVARRPPTEWLHAGSGWGALERHRRAAEGEPPLPWAATPFGDDTLGPEQRPWLELLRTGALPPGPTSSFVVGPTWRRLLRAAPPTPEALLHRGIAELSAGDRAAARDCWRQAPDSAFAVRNLAATTTDPAERADLLLSAHALAPALSQLTGETLRGLLDAGRPAEALAILADQPAATGRLRLLRIEALVAAGDLDTAGRLLAEPVDVADLREGERTLTALWFGYQEALAERAAGRPLSAAEHAAVRADHPVPAALDFTGG